MLLNGWIIGYTLGVGPIEPRDNPSNTQHLLLALEYCYETLSVV